MTRMGVRPGSGEGPQQRTAGAPQEPLQEVGSDVDALADRIDEDGAALAKIVLQRVFEDPFWDVRFGKRGRFHTERDGNYHLSYLTQALRAGSAAVMIDYARWLRSVLVTRGMCSQHLAENFRLFQTVLLEAGIADVQRANAILEQAALALRYEQGLAGAIDAVADAIADELALPGTPLSGQRDIRRHLSFLADSIALERPDLFGIYQAFLERGWSTIAPFSTTLEQVVAALEGRLGRDRAAEIRSHLGRCCESLSADDARA